MRHWPLIALLCAAAPVAAQDSLSDRLRALAQPAPVDPYADEISADLARIEAEAEALFSPDDASFGPPDAPIAIALFISKSCTDCSAAVRDLLALSERLGIGAKLIDVSQSESAQQMMARLTLDVTPSYVMRDKLIRGQMPALVLERYLSP
ncbi:hypothetical protein [Primorskyibacter sp. 2E233]|uniref:hypothetical protein n=1 Tax=Primorskyibacter sp. 2E233 TaxID=3413431 RepID=UPI003BF23B45